MAKVFNGRAATDDYMSTHTLTFSTPEMTLRKFALWLGEQVSAQGGKEQVPRLIMYIQEKGAKSNSEFVPDTDDTFRPTGAVTDMYGGASSGPTKQMAPPKLTPLDRETLEPEGRFCVSCGQKLKANARFCTKCGNQQG
ncbi:zinc ribbon domain-containing protein [Nitrososphaera sp.]|uniref:zinc ribbon domain-containing protein n=1 Tax=Nitrososphaera sp. TaxID=1971748 RepID=UPI002ED88328